MHRERGDLGRDFRRRRRRFAIVAATVIVAVLAPAADAAPVPGTPLPVAPGVPDQGRAWELVTSPEPVSAMLWYLFGISANGERVSYSTIGQLPDSPVGEPIAAPAMAVRGPDGWVNRTNLPPSPQTDLEPRPLAIAADFKTSVWRNETSLNRTSGLFRQAPDGTYTLVTTGSSFLDGYDRVATSADLQHLIFASQEHLLPGDATRISGASIYESVGATLRLVDVDNSGTLISSCGAVTRSVNPISGDGQRIFFSTSPGCAGPKRVYLRASGATTTEISASQCTLADCGPEADVSFVGATPTGSSAFLVTSQRLTNGDSDARADLYRYDVAGGDLTLVSTSWAGNDLIATAGSVRVPAEGSRVYFGAVEQVGADETSAPKLYMADASGCHLVPGGAPNDPPSPFGLNARPFVQLSTDGRYALYASTDSLAPGDSDESADAYRYDAADGTVFRISAGSHGGNGPFDVTIENEFDAQVVVGNHYRAMSDDGSRIFFTTAERLLPEDHNDAADVYEWANGSLGLISAGAGDRPSTYFGSTPDGAAVLFKTADTLLPLDRDPGDFDLYAARIGGGFPASSPPPGCAGPCPAPPRGRSGRSAPASAEPARGGIRIAHIGAAARRHFVDTGWITLLAEVPHAGRLSAEARAKIGGRERTVAATSVRVAAAGPARLRLRLSRSARQKLAKGGQLQVRLSLRLSRLDSVRRVGFRLGGRS